MPRGYRCCWSKDHTDLEHWEASVPDSSCCGMGVRSLIGRETGKKLKNADLLLSYLEALASELLQYITRLNVGEAVTPITRNWIKLRRGN